MWKQPYFGMESDIYRQEELAMGSPLSPLLANVYIEYFEEIAYIGKNIGE